MKSIKLLVSVLLVGLVALSSGCGSIPYTEDLLDEYLNASESVAENSTEAASENSDIEKGTEVLNDNIKSIKFEGDNPTLDIIDDYDNSQVLDFKIEYDDDISEEDFSYEISDKKIFEVEKLEIKDHWFSSDSVNVSVKGLKAGTAYLTLKTADGIISSNKVKITVKSIKSININGKSKRRIKVNKSRKITVDATPAGIKKSDIVVKSSNKKVVKIKNIKCKEGLLNSKITFKIVALKKGKATVTVKSKDSSVKDKIKITVYKPKPKPKKKSSSSYSYSTVNNYSSGSGTTVYITDSGEKYHSAGCRYLKSSHAVSLAEAKASGKTPCSVCNPPQ